jgi:hypothetical protein
VTQIAQPSARHYELQKPKEPPQTKPVQAAAKQNAFELMLQSMEKKQDQITSTEQQIIQQI